jgi:hypothetical protein
LKREAKNDAKREVKEAARRKSPYWGICAVVFVCVAIAFALVNVYINLRLSEYEGALPERVAEHTFDRFFAAPDFESLLDVSHYELADGETRENALSYFNAVLGGGETSFAEVSSAYAESPDAKVYIVKSGERNFARFTIVPSGAVSAHGSALYALDNVDLIRRERPLPEVVPPPEPSLPPYSFVLQEIFSDSVIEAVKAYTRNSRNELSVGVTLKYYEPGSDIYVRIQELVQGLQKHYETYEFEGETADEFLELENGAFSCRVRYNVRYKKRGESDLVDKLDLTVKLRPNADGKYLIYEQYITGAEQLSADE